MELAPVVSEVVGLDPDPDMLAEAAGHSRESGVVNARWVHGLAEQVPDLLGWPGDTGIVIATRPR